MKRVRLITDGSCLGNPGRGGWAAILRYGDQKKELWGSTPETTNNRMEMMAVLRGLQAITQPCEVEIEIDSEYVKNGITKWLSGWKRNGWRTASRSPVKNQDLWQQLDEELKRHQVRWTWVKGHADHDDNNRCDELARDAAMTQGHSPAPRSGAPVPGSDTPAS
jgi:ribonuclease HI